MPAPLPTSDEVACEPDIAIAGSLVQINRAPDGFTLVMGPADEALTVLKEIAATLKRIEAQGKRSAEVLDDRFDGGTALRVEPTLPGVAERGES